MTGKLKLSGDLSKALALESVLKAAREKAEQEAGKRSYHTFAGDRRSYHTSTIQQCVLHLANTFIVSRVCVGVILKNHLTLHIPISESTIFTKQYQKSAKEWQNWQTNDFART